MTTTAWLPRALSTLVLTFPLAVWASDCIYSVYKVRGKSMEPSLREGDVVLVRKADIFTFLPSSLTEEELTTRACMLRIEGNTQSLLLSRPPLVLPGDVVVFCNPNKAFPNEHNIKRVMAVGGQMVRTCIRVLFEGMNAYLSPYFPSLVCCPTIGSTGGSFLSP